MKFVKDSWQVLWRRNELRVQPLNGDHKRLFYVGRRRGRKRLVHSL